jgi:hypothetical protein
MKRILFALLGLVPIAGVTAMDFLPHYDESVQDGFPVKRLYFSDQAQRIYLSVPKGWRVTGDSQRGSFTPENLNQASVVLENSPLNPKIPFAGDGLELYRKTAAALIPAGASNVHVDFERMGELQINGWSSFEISFSYNFYGQSFMSSALFINIAKEEQIRFCVATRQEDFEKVYQQGRTTLASWFAPPPEFEAVLERMSAKSK